MSVCLAPTLAEFPPVERSGYRMRLARTGEDLEKAQRLRFEVFNVELDEGFDRSWETGRDEDVYDAQVHHLLVEHIETDRAVGTYRLQTRSQAEAGAGFYTAEEFDLSPLEPHLDRAVEASRACVHADHREGAPINLLWNGIAKYLRATESQYLFGLCSLTSQDLEEGVRAWRFLHDKGMIRPDLRVAARPEFHVASFDALRASELPPLEKLPPLFDAYMRIATRIISNPAIDRAFKTVDFLAWLDMADVPLLVQKRFGYL